ncbi:MAG: carbohydrate binding domain-containing protein [Lentisphaerota bacterium]
MRYHAGNHIVSFGKKLSVLLPMLVLTVSVFGQSVNLVKNGNFSEGTKEWIPGATGQIDSKVYKQTKDATDTNSLKVTSTVTWVVGEQVNIKVEPNVEYHVSVWVKMENAAQTHVKLLWQGADGKLISTDYLFGGTDGTSDWQEKTGIFKSPANVSSLDFVFLSGGKPETPGTLWIDSVVIEKRASAATSNAQ